MIKYIIVTNAATLPSAKRPPTGCNYSRGRMFGGVGLLFTSTRFVFSKWYGCFSMSFANKLSERLRRWTAERDRVLGLIDGDDWFVARSDIVQWFRRNNTPIPATDELLKIEVHKLRATASGIDPAAALRSAEWLRERGVTI